MSMESGVDITEVEAQTLKDFANKLTKACSSAIGPESIDIIMAQQAYFYALCVKYGKNPFGLKINSKTRKFEPREI